MRYNPGREKMPVYNKWRIRKPLGNRAKTIIVINCRSID
jgi:hypothetical protein